MKGLSLSADLARVSLAKLAVLLDVSGLLLPFFGKFGKFAAPAVIYSHQQSTVNPSSPRSADRWHAPAHLARALERDRTQLYTPYSLGPSFLANLAQRLTYSVVRTDAPHRIASQQSALRWLAKSIEIVHEETGGHKRSAASPVFRVSVLGAPLFLLSQRDNHSLPLERCSL